MGRNTPKIMEFYKKHIKTIEPVALLGYTNNDYFNGELFDLALGNWDINSEWDLGKKYQTIICTRCAYFCINPLGFIKNCHKHLLDGGILYVDWGLGDHWRFSNFKIGWAKEGEQEFAYRNNNYLWSTVWDQEFMEHDQYKKFERLTKVFGYNNVREAIFTEIPVILYLNAIRDYFSVEYDIFTLDKPNPQMYVFIEGEKREK